MSEEQKAHIRRAIDSLRHVAELVSPFLLLIVIYFVKPIFDAVPVVAKQQEIMAVQQQNIANNIVIVNAKQERLDAQIVSVGTKVEVLSEKVNRLERKVDK